MRSLIIVLAAAGVLFAAGSAHAGKSCSTFAKITGYDDASKSITLEKTKGSQSKFFPKTDGAPSTSKIPAKCKSKILAQGDYPVNVSGGRMSITQVRANFSGKMLNDIEDKTWVPNKLQELIASGDTVVVLLRQPPGSDKKAPHKVTTIYMPITDEELAEIERLNNQGEDV